MEIFKWTHKRANGTPIFGWGHSLGTGFVQQYTFNLLLIKVKSPRFFM